MSNASSKSEINWGPLATLLVGTGSFLGAQFIGFTLLLIYATTAGGYNADQLDSFINKPGYVFLGNLLIGASILWLLSIFLKRRKASVAALGLGRFKTEMLGYVAAGYGIYLSVSLIITAVVKALAPHWLEQEQAIGFAKDSQGPVLFLIFATIVILPPLIEEILFRGFLYSGFRKAWGMVGTTLVTSALFAVAHLQGGETSALLWIAALDTFVLSVILCQLRERTGSLWAPIGLHAIKNAVAFLLLFIF